jgi:hypothetical protein
MVRTLPVFKGYTVDSRLMQFRKVTSVGIEFVNFETEEGDRLLARYIPTLDANSEEFRDLADAIM